MFHIHFGNNAEMQQSRRRIKTKDFKLRNENNRFIKSDGIFNTLDLKLVISCVCKNVLALISEKRVYNDRVPL